MSNFCVDYISQCRAPVGAEAETAGQWTYCQRKHTVQSVVLARLSLADALRHHIAATRPRGPSLCIAARSLLHNVSRQIFPPGKGRQTSGTVLDCFPCTRITCSPLFPFNTLPRAMIICEASKHQRNLWENTALMCCEGQLQR